MSRIGKTPITVPAGVTVTIGDDNLVTVKGPKGELHQQVAPSMKVELKDGELTVARPNDEKENRAMHGLYRSLLNNMVVGVTEGFRKELELVGA
jgi:large subunit ribosomal protein L6